MGINLVMVKYKGLDKTETPVPDTTYEEADKYCQTQFEANSDIAVIERRRDNGLRSVILHNSAKKILSYFKEVAA